MLKTVVLLNIFGNVVHFFQERNGM